MEIITTGIIITITIIIMNINGGTFCVFSCVSLVQLERTKQCKNLNISRERHMGNPGETLTSGESKSIIIWLKELYKELWVG
ncbi:hypothetical protein [Candidatus Contubernalis alkaliaceticus]|uniref:hypothetical protein n=1 Tax=Candidatus Contubernalis alkaliaceticus TaxID=338645 RepID=UPI001F4BD901|nr:hypothetical protein [Candidatus Contubernalis alkalaceticus]UNC90610.1 hypothetical protein HUE98_13990 [Candidatus Contubernalis alkalaceticus]